MQHLPLGTGRGLDLLRRSLKLRPSPWFGAHTYATRRVRRMPMSESNPRNEPPAQGRPQQAVEYANWSHDQLLSRVAELEKKLKDKTEAYRSLVASTSSPTAKKNKNPSRAFDPSRYSTRLIALKFAYLGQNYNGYEHHTNNVTPLPTVEEELWKALMKTKLIFPKDKDDDWSQRERFKIANDRVKRVDQDNAHADVNWEGCDYSKCGRTDRGVSAFGQVIGIRVRSNRPVKKSRSATLEEESESKDVETRDTIGGAEGAGLEPAVSTESKNAKTTGEDLEAEPAFDPVKDELPYIHLLNRVLPHDIRVLAWCPNPPPDFSARFSCRERRYKYFFTQPAFSPSATVPAISPRTPDGYLNIAAMREAAQHLVGLHDFRNLCKVDPSKQLTNFERRIYEAGIEEVSEVPLPSYLRSLDVPGISDIGDAHQPKLYAIVIRGSAFLWHQVRHIAALLFLVGQGLESPSVITELLDIKSNPCKPKYEMATDAPLVLWDCIFPAQSPEEIASRKREYSEHGYEDALDWIFVGDPECKVNDAKSRLYDSHGKWERGGIMEDLWVEWRQRKMDEILAAQLLDVVAGTGSAKQPVPLQKNLTRARLDKVFDGGNAARNAGTYTPVMKKERLESVEVVNRKYAERKGLIMDTKDVQAPAEKVHEDE